ncbi:MAG: response regulator [Rhodanobacter sp.]
MLLLGLTLLLLAACIGFFVLARRLRDRGHLAQGAQSLAREAENSKRQLVKHLGHEIRNPLNAILGITEGILGDRGLTLSHQQDVLVLRSAAHQLLMVATNLITLHAEDEATWAPQTGIVAISDLIDELRETVGPILIEKRIKLEVLTEVGSPSQVEADPQILRQILANVLTHSIGLTTVGAVTINVLADESQGVTSKERLRISISDTGVTLGLVESERIFEPYGTEGTLQSVAASGTGLSLHVARKLARQLNGDISYRSHPNGGSIYDIGLPVRILTVNTADTVREQGVVVRFNDTYIRHRDVVRPQRILVTEDQASNRHLITSILEKGGHNVMVATNGEDALKHLNSSIFDVAIMDLRLPGMSGLDVIKLSHVSGKQKRDLPFIALTGEIGADIRHACTAAGVAAFLSKPVVPQRLLETVKIVIERKARVADEGRHVEHQGPVLAGPNTPVMDGITPRGVEDFLHDVFRYSREIENARAVSDYGQIRVLLRSLRGAGHVVGAQMLVEVCSRMIAQKDLEICESIRAELMPVLTRTRISLAELLAQANA